MFSRHFLKEKSHLLLSLLILLWPYIVAREVYGQAEFVYLVKSSSCAHKPTDRSQTGFRIKGTKGLVTALHGIVDCNEIKILNKKGKILYEPLHLISADIDRDVALISSSELDGLGNAGLEIATELPQAQAEAVRVYGHPYGIDRLPTTLVTRLPVLVPLQQLLTDDFRSQLRQRGSPNHLMRVVSLQGTLLPGHSGAPILDKQNRVIGVANGGLKGGFAEICWAVPFPDIEWERPDSVRIKKLQESETQGLFSVEDASAIKSSAETSEDFCSAVKKIFDTSAEGYRPIVGDAKSKNVRGYFQATIKIPGSLDMVVNPDLYVVATMAESKYVVDVESAYYRLEATLTSCFPNWQKVSNNKGGVVTTRWREKREKNEGPEIMLRYEEYVLFLGEIKQKPFGGQYSLKLWFHTWSYW